MKVLLSGGAGFVGSHLLEHFLKNTDWDIISLDRLNHSGNYNRLEDIEIWESQRHRVKLVWHDLRSPINEHLKKYIGDVDYIFHVAANSHVDRSIEEPVAFVMDNVVGTTNMLLFAKGLENLQKFVYFNTDEVYGPAPEGVFYKEWDRYNSGNPYAASKAGAGEMCLAFANTYKMPILCTQTMNIFGERQHTEKFIPKVIRSVVQGEKVTIHSNKEKTKSGSRFYIHARNVGDALLFLIKNGECLDGSGTKGKYNIVGEKEVSNLGMAQFIAKIIGKELKYEMVDFHSSRPGHDLRYSLSGETMHQMGWRLPKTFDESLTKTIKWYLKPENKRWLY